MDTLLDFRGKTALITGAAGGFGRLLSQQLAKRGCNLVIGDLDQAGLDETVSSLALDTNQVIPMICDVSNESQCKAMVDTAIEQFGQLDMAVNNAGIAHSMNPVHKLTEEIMNKQMSVNVNGVMFGMKYQIQAMLNKGKGHILNVSSMAGLGGAPKGGAYAAAKHAVIGLTKTAAVEYAKYGLQVNAICPFYTPTNIMNVDGMNTEEIRARLALGSPSKRLGTVEEIVNVMLLTLSPGNTYMTGQSIAIDGGVSAW